MLEILILIFLCKSIAKKATDKGRSGAAAGGLLVLLWFGGELGFACVAGIAAVATSGQAEPEFWVVYGAALVGAILGAITAFVIVGSWADHSEPPEERDRRYDIDDEPRRKYGEHRDGGRDQYRGGGEGRVRDDY